jgi:glycosyltransferase involved in cell wall biosynthesis
MEMQTDAAGQPRQRQWLVVSNVDLSVQDGQRTHFLEFARALARQIQVTVVNPTPAIGIELGEFEYAPVTFPSLHLPVLSVAVAWLGCLRRLCLQQQPEVIYTRAAGNYVDLIVLLFAKWRHSLSVLEINGAFAEETAVMENALSGTRTWRQRLSSWFALRTVRYSLCLASKVVVVTENLRNYFVSRYHVPFAKVGVYPNGVNVRTFVPQDSLTCKRKVGLNPKKRYIGFVGKLIAWQGLDDLLVAFSYLDASCEDCQLLIVGEGFELQRLKKLARTLGIVPRVDFVGQVPHVLVPDYINACDICVGPFKSKGRNSVTGLSPLKIYEYLACGRPILTSAVPGLMFVAEERVGRVFEPENAADLASALGELLAMSDEQRQEMGLRARRLAVERFSWDSVVEQIMEFTRLV